MNSQGTTSIYLNQDKVSELTLTCADSLSTILDRLPPTDGLVIMGDENSTPCYVYLNDDPDNIVIFGFASETIDLSNRQLLDRSSRLTVINLKDRDITKIRTIRIVEENVYIFIHRLRQFVEMVTSFTEGRPSITVDEIEMTERRTDSVYRQCRIVFEEGVRKNGVNYFNDARYIFRMGKRMWPIIFHDLDSGGALDVLTELNNALTTLRI